MMGGGGGRLAEKVGDGNICPGILRLQGNFSLLMKFSVARCGSIIYAALMIGTTYNSGRPLSATPHFHFHSSSSSVRRYNDCFIFCVN